MSKIMHMDTQYAGITPENDFVQLIDFFYPVGCYFETSDIDFNPNVSWHGAWVLETAGQVHVSAGTGYSVNGAMSNVSDGGATTYTVPTTKLNDANIAHGHGFTQPTVNGGATTTESANATHRHPIIQSTTSGSYSLDYWHWELANGGTEVWNKQTCSNKSASSTVNANASHSHTQKAHTHSVSGGAVADLSGASSTRTAHGHGSISTLQPYIVVNRWHRIA